MAARKQLWHPDSVREKIQASQLINRLVSHVNGKLELSPTQVTAALGLLRKCVPDLAAVEHTGRVTISHEDALAALDVPDGAQDSTSAPGELPALRH